MIYYVEDDDNIRELVVYTLLQMNMPCRGFAEGKAFRTAIAEEKPDLVLLDIMLPGEDGMSLLQFLRENQQTAEIPVIMLTAKGTEMDKVQGLDHGADDYMTKPFGMAELVARIRARLRRTGTKTDAETLRCGTLSIDRRAHKAFVDDEEVPLTLKEYDLLLLLMENSGAVFTREQLLERIWEMGYDGGSRTVDVHVQTLRSKLGHCACMIETVRGVGYRFGGDPA
ncbi:MAG: response regulator transcription factor [Clostridia bacterium]|nr:response regulator transcription factor [Clostridia bacterium]